MALVPCTCDAKVGGSKDADQEKLSHSSDIKTIIDIKTNHSNTINHLYIVKYTCILYTCLHAFPTIIFSVFLDCLNL